MANSSKCDAPWPVNPLFRQVLDAFHGNVPLAASALGVDQQSLECWIREEANKARTGPTAPSAA